MTFEIEQNTRACVNRIRCFGSGKVLRSSIASKEYYPDALLWCEIWMKMHEHIRGLFAFPLIKLSATNAMRLFVCGLTIARRNASNLKIHGIILLLYILILHYNFLFLRNNFMPSISLRFMVKGYICILWN